MEPHIAIEEGFGPEKHVEGVKARGLSTKKCCQSTGWRICGYLCCALLVWLLWVLLLIWTSNCAVESFDVDWVLPQNAKEAGVPEPFAIGTTENMPIDSGLNLSLGGVWWMDGNPLIHEQLVSFAGGEGKGPFPASVNMPTQLQRRWTWSDTFIGRAIIAYYSMTASPETMLEFKFANSSYADITPVADVLKGELFGFKKINEDEWDRVDTYILRRVINPDGTEGPYWQKFITWYKEVHSSGRIVVYSSDSGCKRQCQYFWPCFVCNLVC